MLTVKRKEQRETQFDGYTMIDAIKNTSGNQIVKTGLAEIKPGSRIPKEGFACHKADEYSYIIKGSLSSCVEGEHMEIREGDFCLIPKGHKHFTEAAGNETCTLVWMLVGEEE